MEKGKNTIEELNKFRIDCMYGKKKHYNARDRVATYNRNIGIAIVVLSAIMGTSVYSALSKSDILLAQIIIGIFILLNVILVALQNYLKFEKQALRYNVTADRYLWLMKEAQRLLAYHRDGNKTIEEVQRELERLYQEVEDIHKDEPETSQVDYQKARDGIETGEELYSEKDKQV
ncbi:MAG: SLATT domain-containing protein [Elusimicrobiota bacterium]